jgi:thymidylate kinase
MLHIHNITLEGPDLSGKTSLFNNLHELTNYKYNIQDRSELSMLCYAKMYKRDTSIWHQRLKRKLNDLNHMMIVLLPTFSTLIKRLDKRGDTHQTKDSLRTLYKIFCDYVAMYQNYGTVVCIKGEHAQRPLAAIVLSRIKERETSDTDLISSFISKNTYASQDNLAGLEAHPVKLSLDLKSQFEKGDLWSVLEHEEESEYYLKILRSVLKNIDDEIEGINEHNVKQDVTKTRRFIYTDSTCISLFHTMYRPGALHGGRLNFYAVCRSTDVYNILPFDLKFLVLLCKTVRNCIKIPDQKEMTLELTMHSAHIPALPNMRFEA